MGTYMRVYYLPTQIVMYRVSLHLICSVVKMLLAYKPPSDVETDEQLATVDISARDYDSNTALHLAAEGGHCSVADTLTCISKGASVRARLAALCALSNMPTNITHM